MRKLVSLSLLFCLFFTVVSAAEGESSDVLNWLETAANLYEEKQYEECAAVCDQILEADQTHMGGYTYQALAYFGLQDYQKAYDTLIKQLSLNPNNEFALYHAACAASLLGEEQECMELLEQLFLLAPAKKSDVKSDFRFDSVRELEQYQKLMEISVFVDGELVSFDVAPLMVDNRTLLPMRAVFECFGAEVSFEEETQTARAVKGDMTIEIPIGSRNVMVNGVQQELDVPAMVVDDRTLIPIRFVGEALKADVDWDGKNEVVNITFPAPAGTAQYETVKKQLEDMMIVSVISGGWAQPYGFDITKGASLVILQDKKGLDLLNSLSEEDRSKLISYTVYQNFAPVIGCSPVHAKVIYEGKTYYEGDFVYEKRGEVMDLTYYGRGKLCNVVKQYKSSDNYKDFYLLEEEEQMTSKIGD